MHSATSNIPRINGSTGLLEKHTLPIPLKVEGSLPSWVVGTLFLSVPCSFKVRLKNMRGSISGGDLEYMGADAGQFIETSHLLDGFTMAVRVEFLPGGLNAVYSQRKLVDDLEAKIAVGSAEWNNAITFGKVYGLDQTKNPVTLAAQSAAQLVNGAWNYMSSWLGRSTVPGSGGFDNSASFKGFPALNGSFNAFLPFESSSGQPLVAGFSTSMHIAIIDPVTLDSNVLPIQVMQETSAPPLFATNQAYSSPSPTMDPASKIMYLPVISLSATSGATCSVLASHPGIFPRFTVMTTLPKAVRASVYPLAALSEKYLILVFSNYYVSNLMGTTNLSLYSTLQDAAVYRPEEPLQFFVISRETRQLVATFAGESAVVPPGGVVQAFEQKSGNICIDVVCNDGTEWFTNTELQNLRQPFKRPHGVSLGGSSGTIRRYVLPVSALKGSRPLKEIVVSNNVVSMRPLPPVPDETGYTGTELFDFNTTANYMHVSNHYLDQTISTNGANTHVFPDKQMNKPSSFAFSDGGFVYGLSTTAPSDQSVTFSKARTAEKRTPVEKVSPLGYTHIERIAIGLLDIRAWTHPNCFLGPVFYLSKPDIAFIKTHPLGLHSENVLLVVVRGARNGIAVLNAHTMVERAFVSFPSDQIMPFLLGGTGLGGCWTFGDLPAQSAASPVASPVSMPDTPVSGFPKYAEPFDGSKLPTESIPDRLHSKSNGAQPSPKLQTANAKPHGDDLSSTLPTSPSLSLQSTRSSTEQHAADAATPSMSTSRPPLSIHVSPIRSPSERLKSPATSASSPAPPSASAFQPRAQNPSPPRPSSPAASLGRPRMPSASSPVRAAHQNPSMNIAASPEASPKVASRSPSPSASISEKTAPAAGSPAAVQSPFSESGMREKSLNNSITNLHLPVHPHSGDASPLSGSSALAKTPLSSSITNLNSPIHRSVSVSKGALLKDSELEKQVNELNLSDSAERKSLNSSSEAAKPERNTNSDETPSELSFATEPLSIPSANEVSPISANSNVSSFGSKASELSEVAILDPSPSLAVDELSEVADSESSLNKNDGPEAEESSQNYEANRNRRNSKKKINRKKKR